MTTNNRTDLIFEETLELLKRLISIPSFSGEEEQTANAIEEFFRHHGHSTRKKRNNVIVRSPRFDESKPVVLLNSHHDTVRSVAGWTVDPFRPIVTDDTLVGLGCNDAGGALCALAAAFIVFSEHDDLPFNLIFAATAEEEIAGQHGIEDILTELGRIDMAIIGEPTGMELAIAERGLLVLDCIAHGVSGHAARDLGVNAIDEALKDIHWFHSYRFARVSELLGEVKMTVTEIHGGTQHNVIPDRCSFVVDVRVTDEYTHEEILETIRDHIGSDMKPRSLRLLPSAIEPAHPLVRAAKGLNIRCFASPTMSDQALIPFPSVKIGPGRSERSHTADEFIFLSELRAGIEGYVALLERTAMEIAHETLE